MRPLSYLSGALLAGLLAFSASSRADVVRVATYEFASGDDFFRYTAMRAENNHYLSAQHGFVSITWYSDRKGLVAGSTSIWKTAKDADAAYGSARYEAFARMNIQPYVKERSIHVFELDKVK